MKKLFTVLVLLLAMNFLALAGAVGYLFKTGKLDKTKLAEVRKLLFPPAEPAAPATQPSASDATTRPMMQLDQLLAQQAGRSTSEQVLFIQHSFDAQMLQMDRRQRELADLQRQVDLANDKLARDRDALNKEEQGLKDAQQSAAKLATDQGFQDSLALYQSMPSKQVKSIFMTLGEQTVVQYLEAMPARTASKIIKEFKTPDETAFVQQVLERMRQAQAATQPSAAAP